MFVIFTNFTGELVDFNDNEAICLVPFLNI